MIPILRTSNEQMYLIEAMLRANENMYLVARGDNVPLWRVQRNFEPVIIVREYELVLRGRLLPRIVKLNFEFNTAASVPLFKQAKLMTNRKGINSLKQCMPDVFGKISEDDGDDGKIVEVENGVVKVKELEREATKPVD